MKPFDIQIKLLLSKGDFQSDQYFSLVSVVHVLKPNSMFALFFIPVNDIQILLNF